MLGVDKSPNTGRDAKNQATNIFNNNLLNSQQSAKGYNKQYIEMAKQAAEILMAAKATQ